MKRKSRQIAASSGWMPVLLIAIAAIGGSVLILLSSDLEQRAPSPAEETNSPVRTMPVAGPERWEPAAEASGELDTVARGRLEVLITDQEQSRPLQYTSVLLAPSSGDQVRQGGMTGPDGCAAFEGILAGEYLLTALHLGKAKRSQKVVLGEGESLSISWAMEDTIVKTFDEHVVEGEATMIVMKETAFRQTVRSQPLAEALPSDWDAAPMPRGHVQRDAEVLARLDGGRADELWVITKPSGPVAEDPNRPRCGVMRRVGPGKLEMPLRRTEVVARVTGAVAEVELRQHFHNPCDEKIEAEYVFPLPHDAAVHGFRFQIGDRMILGVVREKEEAERIYHEARRRGHRAALLQQERPNIFTERLANLEPGEDILVTLEYLHPLSHRDGSWEFVLPLVVGPRFNPAGFSDPIVPVAVERGQSRQTGTAVEYLAPGQSTAHEVEIQLDVEAGGRIEEYESPNHVVEITELSPTRMHVELSPNDRVPNKDFVFRYRLNDQALQTPLLVSRGEGESYFSLILSPPKNVELLHATPMEMVFVLDCSGSMRGWPLAKAKEAVARALRKLDPQDRFQIIRFSMDASGMGDHSLEASPANIQQGLAYLESLQSDGGTMMIEGIKAALDLPRVEACRRIVSFLTDGFIGNEQEIFREIALRRRDAVLFSFGVGNSVNRYLLEGMARQGRGAAAFLMLPESSLEAVDAFYERVRHPALRELELEWKGFEVEGQTPARVPDLYPGRPVVVYGKLNGDRSGVLRLSGRIGDSRYEKKILIEPDHAERKPGIERLWARRRLMELEDELAVDPSEELEEQILALALEHGLTSRFTSMVAADSLVVTEAGELQRVIQPVPVPEGVRYETTVSGGQ